MANGIVPDEGLADELVAILVNDATVFASWVLLLWVNDYTPDESTTVADLVEATFAGYSRHSLIPAQWGAPVVASHIATSIWGTTPVTWTNGDTGDVTVYGCAFLDLTAGVLRKVERFDAPDIAPISTGGTISVTPAFSYRSQLASE